MASESITLQAQALHIVRSFAASSHYATFDDVLRNLLDWHRAPSFAHLPVHLLHELQVLRSSPPSQIAHSPPEPKDLPVLRYIWDLEQLLHSFVTTYLTSRGEGGLATFLDMEVEAVAMLDAYATPTLEEVFGSTCSKLRSNNNNHKILESVHNPEDIDIDAVEDDDAFYRQLEADADLTIFDEI